MDAGQTEPDVEEDVAGVSAATTDPFESQALSPAGWYIDHVRFEAR